MSEFLNKVIHPTTTQGSEFTQQSGENGKSFLQEKKHDLGDVKFSQFGYQRLEDMQATIDVFCSQYPIYKEDLNRAVEFLIRQSQQQNILRFNFEEVNKITDGFHSMFSYENELEIYKLRAKLAYETTASGLEALTQSLVDMHEAYSQTVKEYKSCLIRFRKEPQKLRDKFMEEMEKKLNYMEVRKQRVIVLCKEIKACLVLTEIEIKKRKFSCCPSCKSLFTNLSMLVSNCGHKICFPCALRGQNTIVSCETCKEPLIAYFRIAYDQLNGRKNLIRVTEDQHKIST